MWNRLQPVSWIFAMLLLLGTSTGIAHATPVPAYHQSIPTSATMTTTGPDYSKFAGLWVAHGAFMLVAPNGNVHFEARTYNWCGPNVPQPCDSIVGNQLRYGYHEQLSLSRTTGTVAYGTVIDSNQQPDNRRTTVTLTLGPEDTLIYNNNGSITLLCGPHAPAGTCGA
jgi:hypothetical protein